MQDVFVQKPYQFVPPFHGKLLPRIVRDFTLFRGILRRSEGVYSYECRHADRIRESIDRGDSVLIAPNHCRTADPMVMGFLEKESRALYFAMASWHLFNQGWFQHYAIRLLGAFSVNREGLDRQAIDYAIRILEEGERPLVIFPEGTASRVNDRLLPLLDGVAFVARTAAKRRKRHQGGRVVIHPVAIKYRFQADLITTIQPVIEEIEHRLTWRSQKDKPWLVRLRNIGEALLSLKELEYLGACQSGTLAQRQANMINHLLHPLEGEWLGKHQDHLGVVPRIKALRMKILPDMFRAQLNEPEKQLRWRQIEDTYLAQQISCYPEGYLEEYPSIDRILETVERFEEDLTDKARVHGKLHAIMHVEEAIEVSTERDRSAPVDPLLARLRESLQGRLDQLAEESPLFVEPQSQANITA